MEGRVGGGASGKGQWEEKAKLHPPGLPNLSVGGEGLAVWLVVVACSTGGSE